MSLEPDSIWEMFVGAENFENFKKNILKPFFLKPEIPDDIRTDIITCIKLLEHSYYAYEFIDVAFTHSVITLEKAMRFRYKEIHESSSSKLSLQKLIGWFFENNYFEPYNDQGLSLLRDIRNKKVHSEDKMIGGQLFMRGIYNVIDRINDLYCDVFLRGHRKSKTLLLNEQLEVMLKEGGIATLDGKRYIVFKADVVFFKNETSPYRIRMLLWPIFDPIKYKDLHNPTTAHFNLTIENWSLDKSEFRGVSISGNSMFSICPINNENQEKFTTWQLEAQQLDCWGSILYNTVELGEKLYTQELRSLHANYN